MKSRNIIGVQFDPQEIKNSVKIKLDPETIQSIFPENKGKNAYDYLKEFLQSDEEYDKILNAINILIHSSLTGEEKESCPCKNPDHVGNIEDNERACATQWAQFQFAYFLSAQDYVNTILNHKVIFEDKEALKQLTWNYFNCFEVLPRIVYFDVDKLAKYALEANFKALSKIFEGSDVLNYLKGINSSIDVLGEEKIHNELYKKQDLNFIDLQMRFLENKRKYLKEKLALAEKEEASVNYKKIRDGNNIRPNRTDLAYFFYYLSQTNTRVTENVFPSLAAYEEIGAMFEKNPKNIQKAYNSIVANHSLRLKKRRDNNLGYVIEHMLPSYSEALNLAKDELKIAQLKW